MHRQDPDYPPDCNALGLIHDMGWPLWGEPIGLATTTLARAKERTGEEDDAIAAVKMAIAFAWTRCEQFAAFIEEREASPEDRVDLMVELCRRM